MRFVNKNTGKVYEAKWENGNLILINSEEKVAIHPNELARDYRPLRGSHCSECKNPCRKEGGIKHGGYC